MIFYVLLMVVMVTVVTGITIQTKIAKKPSNREIELAASLRKCRDKANQYRETDPGLSYEILDVVGGLEKKELL